MGKRIVAVFGLETLDIIDGKAERLLEVEEIGPIRPERIGRAWQEQKLDADKKGHTERALIINQLTQKVESPP